MNSNVAEQEYYLRWNNHENNLCLVLESMLKRGVLVDVTLSCEGKSHKVHRAILSACSPYFEDLLIETDHPHPIIILKDVKSEELKALIDYMYTGQVTVSQSKLESFLKTAESLKIRGLVNHAWKAQQEQAVHLNPDSCIPLRKRRRKLSGDYNQTSSRNDSSEPIRQMEGPTDLSLPKLETEGCFQPVIQTVSYSGMDSANVNQPSRIYLKPKEALISPPLSDVSENGSPERERAHYNIQDDYVVAGSSSINEDDVFYRSGIRQDQHQLFVERGGETVASISRHVSQSDDEDMNPYNQETEIGTPMVRSGVCTVCGCFRSDLRQHMDSHSGQSFQCDYCGRTYPRRKTLNQHIKRSHPDKNVPPVQ